MRIAKKVAKLRLLYHRRMLDVCDAANQLGILKDEKAEKVMKHHVMQCLDCMDHLGFDVSGYLNKKEKS